MNEIIGLGSQFPGEYLKAALIGSLIGVSVLAGGFRYLNRSTRRRHVDELRCCKAEADVLRQRVLSTEERYRSLFEQASEGIVVADAQDLCILELNQTARRLLGINSAAPNILSSFCRIQPEPQTAPQTGPEWFDAACRHRNLALVRRDGGTTAAEVDGAPIRFEGRAAYQFFLREVSDRARLEEQLRQSEKLSALGQMISGVAHELNNPLAVIKGYMELVLRRDDLSVQTRSDLEKVSRECHRATKLVSNFLSFAREQPMHRESLELNALVRRVAESRRPDLESRRVDLELQLDANVPAIQADPDQLQQVLINLMNNALQALAEVPRPGRLKISTQRAENLIRIQVEDNGPGVPAGAAPYIFEPFFTTREVGKGSGLGLSIAHSIVTDHHGRIFHQPSAGGGACFVVELPVVSAAAPPPSAVPAEIPAPSARILVLDDDKMIAELLGDMLSLLGHSATLCHSAPEALEVLDRQTFDVILSDFRMPKMNGEEFYRRAIGKKPELARRVVFLTGDVVNEETQAFLESTGNPHLSKPFQLARVEETVAEVLRSSGAG